MNRARAYVFATLGIVVLASLSLWLVPGAVRQAFRAPEADAVPLNMSQAQATAQVDSALQAYGEGIEKGDAELALSGFDASDTAWLVKQLRIAEEVHARLAGHPARLLYAGGYYLTRPGRADEVATSIYKGALVMQDSLTGEIVHEAPYQALAREGRFRLVPPPEDTPSQIHYRNSLGGLYREVGMEEKALGIWRQVLRDIPEGGEGMRIRTLLDIAGLLAEREDFAGAYAAYEQALALVSPNSFSSFEIEGKTVTLKKDEGLKYKLAQCARRMGEKDRARKWCEELTGSGNDALVAAARRMMAEL